MDIDIAKTAVSIGESAKGIDWREALVTLSSAFLGAFFAYKFNLKQTRKKEKEQMADEFAVLYYQMFFLFDGLEVYKEEVLDYVKKDYDKKNFEKAIDILMIPNIKFNLDRYLFLSSFNRYLLSDLNNTEKLSLWLLDDLKEYNQNVMKIMDRNKRPTQAECKRIYKMFQNFYANYETFCVKIYYLNKEMLQCYEKYFNYDYLENITENAIKELDIKKLAPNEFGRKEYKELEKEINKDWSPEPYIGEWWAYERRKLKHHFFKFIHFFFKPKTQVKCENIKKKKTKDNKNKLKQ